jgi:hypothetical protein
MEMMLSPRGHSRGCCMVAGTKAFVSFGAQALGA